MAFLPHLRTSSARLSTLRSASLTNSTAKRFFTPSAYNMTIKTYFDVSWTGPEVQVDSSGNVTSTGSVKGKLPSPH
jgi:peptidylprolyl isomerase